MKYWFVSWNHGNGIYCTNLCSAENADDVRAAYAKREDVTVREADGYEIESAKRRGMPVTECPHIEPETAEIEQEEETMKNYSYEECMKSDILDYIAENIDRADYIENREELEERLNDDCWIADSVTGNASGSYFCNAFKAREAFQTDSNAADYFEDACSDFDLDAAEVGRHFIRADYKWIDCIIRCYLLGGMISEVLDELEEAGYFDESEADTSDIITAAREQLTA